jgi:hypothetical protein
VNPKEASGPEDDASFDEAIAEIYHRQMELRRAEARGL